MAQKKEKAGERAVIHYCRECAHVTPVTDWHTLSVHDRQPTLGRCPYWTVSKSVLLSQRSCTNFKHNESLGDAFYKGTKEDLDFVKRLRNLK